MITIQTPDPTTTSKKSRYNVTNQTKSVENYLGSKLKDARAKNETEEEERNNMKGKRK